VRRWVMIAMALAGRPRLLIADEPTTALDVTVQRSILRLLSDLRETTGMALMLVSHDLDVVKTVASQIVVMYAGLTVEEGGTADVLDNSAHPYTRALLAARPISSYKAGALRAISGSPPSPGDRPAGCPFAPRCPEAAPRCTTAEVALRPFEPGHLTACVRSEELYAR
jgi:oligopeptide/dipeptide ABC transporter ATP-binding protein